MSFSKNYFSLIMKVQALQMGKHYPKMQCSTTIAGLSIFGSKTKIALLCEVEVGNLSQNG